MVRGSGGNFGRAGFSRGVSADCRFCRRRIVGYEGLIRGPSDSALHSPLNLFEAAEQCQQLLALERACRQVTLRRFAELRLQKGALFLNISPQALLDPAFRPGETLGWMRAAGLSQNRW